MLYLCVFGWFILCSSVLTVCNVLFFEMLIVSNRLRESSGSVMPDKITVVCTGVEGIYYPDIHL